MPLKFRYKNALSSIRNYLKGRSEEEETARVEKWYDSVEERENVFGDASEKDAIKEKIFRQILDNRDQPAKVIPLSRRRIVRIAAASVILAGSAVGGYLLLHQRENGKEQVIAEVNQTRADISAPDSSKAVVVLADGRRIELDKAGEGMILQQGSVQLFRKGNGDIVYAQKTGAAAGAEQVNTLINPKGSKPIHLTLADGSVVWINSNSTLKYPVSFPGADRKVELSGEGYFEIAKDQSRPFYVNCPGNDAQVRVLGTHFNINAYSNEKNMKVTLLEGAVKFSRQSRSCLLAPGQQAIAQQNGKQDQDAIAVVDDIDVEEVMAWKNGQFIFNGSDVQQIMRELERWYNVEVQYEGKQSDKHFTGIVGRNLNISEVLKIMERAGIRFTIEGRKITVGQANSQGDKLK
ncbi:FecR family protein [Flavihumibacter petaseus]|uniref:Putative anti-sigma factor n=1 Tax=Flavihumibacter petaseus NBRC 106054 TaxID=1220578 RepID=A0A0E9MXA5_9BACT|nr:FecR family protein [Flavihumibacter petaseus]GAO42041.1 putative anti-sigma factor [Flavihumibacter petaseus NBRC 106054]